MKMVDRSIQLQNNELDHVKVLRALTKIPFGVGKNLLIDFLVGNTKNKSIRNNNVSSLEYFNSFDNKDEISRLINNLIKNGLIEVRGSKINRFWKVLLLTDKGREEIFNPKLHTKKLKNNLRFKEAIINEKDREIFNRFKDFLARYNDEQKKAIVFDSDKILCIAGAGSGKTTVLTKRIEFLVKYGGVNPKKILAITFTRKARREMANRLLKLGISEVSVETFNSFCEKILRKYGNQIYGRSIRVMNYGDKVMAIMSALSNESLEMKDVTDKYFSDNQKRNKTNEELSNIFISDCFFILDYFKSKNEELYDFSDKAVSNKESAKIIYNICKYVKEYMNQYGLRDYTDQILDAIKFFKNNKEFIPEFDHILVDEYQDVNAMQIELIDILNSKNLFCVGDPRQSIFGWRGSSINYILNFGEKYPECEFVTLTKNYRSNNHIVDFMNASIEELGLPDIKHNFIGEKEIKIFNFNSEDSEFSFVIQKILSSGIEREEIFVLARTNRQLDELSRILREKNINHVVKTDEIKRPIFAKMGDLTLATIHAIKGLEAKMVFVIGCNEQNFPCKASDHPVIEMVKVDEYDKEEEEKRLFYVAISRTKEKLYLSYTGKKPTYFINDKMLNIINGLENNKNKKIDNTKKMGDIGNKVDDINKNGGIDNKIERNKKIDTLYNCIECGREIRHKGKCFPCNIKTKKLRELNGTNNKN